MRLFILGNGFDLHHNLPTKFRDFKSFVKSSEPDVFEAVDKYLPVDDSWSDLESALAYLDYDHVFEDNSGFLVSYGADDWSDAYHHDFQYEVGQVSERLSSGLVEALHNWLTTVTESLYYTNCKKLLPLTNHDCFITFNYTHVLRDIYSVDDAHVFHVHGSLECGSDGIVLGHDWDPKNGDRVQISNPEDADTRSIEATQIINELFKSTFKPSDQIIRDNIGIFESIGKYDEIYILGHSLNDVDLPYLEVIEANSKSNTNWFISYLTDSDKLRVEEFVSRLDLQNVIIGPIEDLLPTDVGVLFMP